MLAPHLQSLAGIFAILGVAWLCSEDRRAFPVRIVLAALAVQFTVALVLLKTPAARAALFSLTRLVDALTAATRAGTSFVFGYVGGASPPFAVIDPRTLTSFAFQILPLILVISALAAVLWHWRVLPVIVRAFAWVLGKTLGIGGAVGLCSAATVFFGMVEAPLLIRPYLSRLSRSELFTLCTVGLATIAGTVFVLYATILQPTIPGALGHILVASFLSLPGAVMISRIMIPGGAQMEAEAEVGFGYYSSMDAVARGTEEGLKLWLGILSMLIVVIAFVALADILLRHFPPVSGAPLTLERIFGWLFAPVVWLYGVPWHEAGAAGALMGEKTVLNELIAYVRLAALPPGVLDPRSRLIMLYAMCGFANPGSVGIMIAGMGGLMPERRRELVPLVMRALLSGTLATGLTGAIIGLLPIA